MLKKTKNKKQKDTKVLAFIIIVLLLIGLVFTISAAKQKTHEDTSAATVFVGLHASGNKIVTKSGQQIFLRGVSTSGTETGCVQGGGAFGANPANQQEITAMKSWNINVVRVPLNEDCWLGINGANPGGSAYQTAIEGYVNLLTTNNMAVILDLHWNAPGATKATSQQNMADSDHSPAFWTSVANTFKNNGSVIFELYNEPHDISWDCWKNGCTGYAGMQTMLNSVRATGATNLVIMGGLAWSDDLSGWLANKPTDPLNNIGAAWHSYNFNACNNTSCWNSQVKPVATAVPLIGTEIGETDCGGSYVQSVFNWLNSIGQNYTGWAWFAGGCGFPSLISDWNGTPTAEGQALKTILTGSSAQPVPVSTGTGGTGGTTQITPTVAPLTPTFGAIGDCTKNNTCPSTTPAPGATISGTVSQTPQNTPSGTPTSTPTGSTPGGNNTNLLIQLLTLLLDLLKLLFGAH